MSHGVPPPAGGLPPKDPGRLASEPAGWSRPLVVGASGQVGTALRAALTRQAEAAGRPLHLVSTSREGAAGGPALDLRSLRTPEDAAALLDGERPDAIFCPGAMTFVDGCEDEPGRAFSTNANGPSALASYARSRGIPFALFSSDYVFSGSAADPGPYDEAHTPAPLNVYGRSKLEGERAVLRVHPGALVVRTSWVYGPDPGGKNFVTTLRRQLGDGQTVRVPPDQISTPTLNVDLAETTLALLRARVRGVVHVAGPELVSRYELARHVARFFGLDETLIEGVPTAALHQRALRPLHSGLRSTRIGEWTSAAPMHVLSEGLALMAGHAG